MNFCPCRQREKEKKRMAKEFLGEGQFFCRNSRIKFFSCIHKAFQI